MNTRFLIIIGTIIAITISVTSLVIIDYIELESRKRSAVAHNPSITCYEPTSESPHKDAAWNLDSCYWFIDDPYIPYELQRVLDYCSNRYHYSDDLLVFTNNTHSINNFDCKWETPPLGTFPGELIFEESTIILDDCETTNLTTSNVCKHSLSHYPMIVIIIFISIVSLLVSGIVLVKKK